jgi:hypothetical protein
MSVEFIDAKASAFSSDPIARALTIVGLQRLPYACRVTRMTLPATK